MHDDGAGSSSVALVHLSVTAEEERNGQTTYIESASVSQTRTRQRFIPREVDGATWLPGGRAAATSGREHFCDYATGSRPLAANHKNATDRHVPS